MGSKQAEETGWQIQKPPWATWREGGEGELSASGPMVTRAAREWPSFLITLLLKRKELSSPTPLWKTTMLNPSEVEGRVRVPGG